MALVNDSYDVKRVEELVFVETLADGILADVTVGYEAVVLDEL